MALPNTFLDNSKTPAPNTNVGFKISKPGYDAQKTAGRNFVFNSSWPSLPIAFETTIANPITSTSSFATIAHNLGFAPFSMAWYYGPDPNGTANTSSRFSVMVDKTNIYLYGNQQNTTPFTATTLKIRCFQLDLDRDIDYNLAPGDTFNLPYDNNFGIKVVKYGKNITSKDMRDYALHSRCQSPLIQAVKTITTANPANPTVTQFTNKLSYPVWVYGFIKLGATVAGNLHVPANTFLPAPYYAQAYPRVFTDGFTSYLQYNTGVNGDNGASLVILRDPMFASNQLTVQF